MGIWRRWWRGTTTSGGIPAAWSTSSASSRRRVCKRFLPREDALSHSAAGRLLSWRALPMTDLIRCPWAKGELYHRYHDVEWGVPVHDDRKLFEMLILEGAQAGLSWSTILNKRENYRKAFDEFDPARVARYGEA